MKPVLSPKELAQAIGVSESSLKRWADDGLVRVARTAGGHRRIQISEAIRFIRESHSPLIHPEILGLPEVADAQSDFAQGRDESEQFFLCLREGWARKARGLIMSVYLRGESVAAICDAAVQPAMERIGDLWRHDDMGVFFEHRATDICIQAIQQMRTAIETPADGPAAVGGGPTEDPYMLPSLTAATALSAVGCRTFNLGPETPLDTLVTAAKHHDAKLVWLSVSTDAGARIVERDVDALAAELGSIGAKLAIGGRLHPKIKTTASDAIFIGDSLAELTAYAKGLLFGRESGNATHVYGD